MGYVWFFVWRVSSSMTNPENPSEASHSTLLREVKRLMIGSNQNFYFTALT